MYLPTASFGCTVSMVLSGNKAAAIAPIVITKSSVHLAVLILPRKSAHFGCINDSLVSAATGDFHKNNEIVPLRRIPPRDSVSKTGIWPVPL